MTLTQLQTEALQPLVLWMVEQLQLRLDRRQDDYVLHLPGSEGQPPREVCFTFEADRAGGDIELVAADRALFNELVAEMRKQGRAVHARPRIQPQSVHEITALLFPSYRVEGGHIHLAGCTLDDLPFLRLICRNVDAAIEQALIDRHLDPVDEVQAAELGLDDVVPYGPHPPRLADEQLDCLLRAAEASLTAEHGQSNGAPRREPLFAALLWCKHAEGKLHMTIGERTEELPFSGWARTLQAPAWVCPHTGVATWHLAATDDGRIAAADQIETCSATGRRMLSRELETCAATGARVLPELLVDCPVTSTKVLRSGLLDCAVCSQKVSRRAIEQGLCRACREMAPVPKSDPRLAGLLARHPRLSRWHHWKLAETAEVYIAVASGWFRRLLLVVDKHTLEPRHSARSNRALVRWTPLSPEQQQRLLGERLEAA